jgi:A/G-specific adenine glycosylase
VGVRCRVGGRILNDLAFIEAAGLEGFRYRLLEWYGRCRRPLRWRDTRDPYCIWVSEIMLQQTRVAQMDQYFARFVECFPTVEQLAAASEDEVLKAWEGLGYYSRARRLHQAARCIVEVHGGKLPDTYEGLLALPGIGQYTAAAVSSIAFDRDHPVLDGNVVRVLCRLLRIETDPARTPVKNRLIAAAENLLARGQAGDFNQAMMELGAQVCTPRRPQCPACPVRRWCRASAELEDPSRLPVRPPSKEKPHYQVAAGLIWKDDKLLIAQRPAGGMLGGLWEFPGGKQEPGETLPECLQRELREELGIEVEVGEHLVSVDHAYSHFRITLHAFAARYVGGEPQALGCAAWCWVGIEELAAFAFPRADRRIIESLNQHRCPWAWLSGGEREQRGDA